MSWMWPEGHSTVKLFNTQSHFVYDVPKYNLQNLDLICHSPTVTYFELLWLLTFREIKRMDTLRTHSYLSSPNKYEDTVFRKFLEAKCGRLAFPSPLREKEMSPKGTLETRKTNRKWIRRANEISQGPRQIIQQLGRWIINSLPIVVKVKENRRAPRRFAPRTSRHGGKIISAVLAREERVIMYIVESIIVDLMLQFCYCVDFGAFWIV